MWVRPLRLPGKGEVCLVSKGSWEGLFKFSLTYEARLRATVRLADGVVIDFDSQWRVAARAWTHVAFGFSSQRQQLVVYVNGRLDASFSGPVESWAVPQAGFAFQTSVGECHHTDAGPRDDISIVDVHIWRAPLELAHFVTLRTMLGHPLPVMAFSVERPPGIGSSVPLEHRLRSLPPREAAFWTELATSAATTGTIAPRVVAYVHVAHEATLPNLAPIVYSLLHENTAPISRVHLVLPARGGDACLTSLPSSLPVAAVADARVVVVCWSLDAAGVRRAALRFEATAGVERPRYVLVQDASAVPLPHALDRIIGASPPSAFVFSQVVSEALTTRLFALENGWSPSFEVGRLPVVRPFQAFKGVNWLYGALAPSGDALRLRSVLAAGVPIVARMGDATDLVLLDEGESPQGVRFERSVMWVTPSATSGESLHPFALQLEFDRHRASPFVPLPRVQTRDFGSSSPSSALAPPSASAASLPSLTYVMHCGGSMGGEAAVFFPFIDPARVMLRVRRKLPCDHPTDTVTRLPAFYVEALERGVGTSLGGDENIVVYHHDFVLIGELLSYVRDHPPPRYSGYQIGRFMFEVLGIHRAWRDVCNSLDEVWVPTAFHARLFADAGVTVPIHVIPEAVDTDIYDPELVAPLDIDHLRRLNPQHHLQPPTTLTGGNTLPFVFTSTFSWQLRKGWQELVAAYFARFSASDHVLLVIHSRQFGADEILQEIDAFLMADASIAARRLTWPPLFVSVASMVGSELLRLYAATDCYVQPSRGEGWGLPIHEAMAMGLPVITTNWSGMTGYADQRVAYMLSYELIPSEKTLWFAGYLYAKANVTQLGDVMREVYSNPQDARAKGRLARSWVAERFHPRVVGEMITQRVEAIHAARIEPKRPPVIHPGLSTVILSHDVNMCRSFASRRSVRRVVPAGRRVRVVWLSTYPPTECGIATFSHDLLRRLTASDRLDFHVVSLVDMLVTAAQVNASFTSPLVKLVLEKQLLESYDTILQYIEQHADVVVVQHEFGIFGGTAGSFLACMMRKVTAPIVTTVHTLHDMLANDYRSILRTVIRLSDAVVVMNDLSRYVLESHHNVYLSRSLAVIPHGVSLLSDSFNELTSLHDRSQENFGWAGEFVVMASGLCSSGKGYHQMLRALRLLKQTLGETGAWKAQPVRFVVVGNASPNCGQPCAHYCNAMPWLAQKLGVAASFTWLNDYVSDAKLEQLLLAADVYVSLYEHALVSSSGTMSRAMGLGRAVIATPFIFARSVLSDERALLGRLVPFDNTARHVVPVILELYHKPQLRLTIGKNAFQMAKEWSWERVARMYEELILSKMGSP